MNNRGKCAPHWPRNKAACKRSLASDTRFITYCCLCERERCAEELPFPGQIPGRWPPCCLAALAGGLPWPQTHPKQLHRYVKERNAAARVSNRAALGRRSAVPFHGWKPGKAHRGANGGCRAPKRVSIHVKHSPGLPQGKEKRCSGNERPVPFHGWKPKQAHRGANGGCCAPKRVSLHIKHSPELSQGKTKQRGGNKSPVPFHGWRPLGGPLRSNWRVLHTERVPLHIKKSPAPL